MELFHIEKGENMSLYADITKIRKDLNWFPKTSIDEGLDKTVNWYLEKMVTTFSKYINELL